MGIGNSKLGQLDAHELRILRASWEDIMRNAEENGAYIFARFLKSYNYASYFKKFQGISPEHLYEDIAFKDHSFLVMTTINKIVLLTNSDEELLKELYKLGKLHLNKNLTSRQFLELKGTIIDIMEKKFHTPVETLKIWSKAFDICYFYVFQVLEANQGTSSFTE